MHALTGCDSTSAFVGKGKKLAPTLLQQKCTGVVAISAQLASAYDPSPEVVAGCQEFICRLDGSKECSLNLCRYQLSSAKSFVAEQLPPSEGAFAKHVAHAAYQSSLWQRCLDNYSEAPSPHGHG
jgi:hypothetical protein